MSRKVKKEAEKTRGRILASALALFTRKGYDRTTFNDIAARLKMTKGAVYWHFESKEALLVALVTAALEKFQRDLRIAFPEGELTYPAVAEMMVRNASQVVETSQGAAFFRLMKCQIRWADDSMEAVRQNLLTNCQYGPKEAFKRAIANDIAAGRVRADVDSEEVATVAIALWDGLVQARIDRFLECDLVTTLRHAYYAIWAGMREPKAPEQYQLEHNLNNKEKEEK